MEYNKTEDTWGNGGTHSLEELEDQKKAGMDEWEDRKIDHQEEKTMEEK